MFLPWLVQFSLNILKNLINILSKWYWLVADHCPWKTNFIYFWIGGNNQELSLKKMWGIKKNVIRLWWNTGCSCNSKIRFNCVISLLWRQFPKKSKYYNNKNCADVWLHRICLDLSNRCLLDLTVALCMSEFTGVCLQDSVSYFMVTWFKYVCMYVSNESSII